MNTDNPSPKSIRERSVFLIWKNLPRLGLLFLIFLVIFLFSRIDAKKKELASEKARNIATEQAPVNVVILSLSPTTIRDKIDLPGSIEPWTKLSLKSQVNGTVSALLVQEGETVRKGQIVAQIEESDYQITLKRAEAAYKLAQSNFARDNAIFKKGVISPSQLEEKKTSLMTAQADLENAKLQLSRCTITAPIEGIIQKLDAKQGLLMSTGDPVATLVKISTVKAVIGIPESDVTAVRKLQEIALTIKALGPTRYLGKQHFLSPTTDTMARLYRLELAVDNPEKTILPGMFVRAEIVKRTIKDAITVPFYSVISRNDETYVFTEKNGLAHKNKVSLGVMENWTIEIQTGLKAGEHVIVEGQRNLENGQNVHVVQEISTTGAEQ